MIIKGNPGGNVGFWAKHLMRDDTNERAEVVEMSGLLADDLPTALREMQAIAKQSRSEGNFLYQANINPLAHEHLTPEQWKEAIDTLEKNLGLEGHQRIVVEHVKEGREHRHIIWNRVDVDTLRVADMGGNWRIHTATARELEDRFGLTPTPTPTVEKAPSLELWEIRAAERSGIDPVALKAELTELWRSTDSGKAFAAAIEDRGYILARGDRRDFCIIDQAGDAHSLARRLDGVRAKDVRERMGDIDRDSLPTVAEARAVMREVKRERDIEEKPQERPATKPALRETRDEQTQKQWRRDVQAERARVADAGGHDPGRRLPLSVIHTTSGATEKLADFVTGLLSCATTTSTHTPAELDQMQQIQAQRRALAAIESIAESMERGEGLKAEDIQHLTPTHLENIKAHGDDYVRELIERAERDRQRYLDWGREREL